jgi:flotillin
VVLSGDNSKVTSEVNRLLAELPASVHALTGVDLSKVCTFLAVLGIPRQPRLERLVASGK